MANMLVKEISADLLAEVNYAAAKAGMNQREWVIEVLTEATGVVDSQAKISKRKNRQSSLRDKGAGTANSTIEAGAREADEVSRPAPQPRTEGKVKKLTAEEFQKLSNSDKLKAQREGRV